MCLIQTQSLSFFLPVILADGGYKEEADCVESWAESCQEVSQEILQEADNLRASDSPDPQVWQCCFVHNEFDNRRIIVAFPSRLIAAMCSHGSVGRAGCPVFEGLVVLNPAPS